MGVYLLDSIARGGTSEAAAKGPETRLSSSLSQEELELSSTGEINEKSGHIFHSTSKARRRSRAASI